MKKKFSTNATLEQLRLFHTPRKAIQQDMGFPRFDIGNELILQYALDRFFGHKLAVSHICHNVEPRLRQNLACSVPE